MKLVAFIDTLGFKFALSQKKHTESEELLKKYSNEIYKLWEETDKKGEIAFNGKIFSDSLILYSKEEITDLNKEKIYSNTIDFLTELYKRIMINVGLPLRGGLAIGAFSEIPTKDFKNLNKGLIVGQGFIDAYILESGYNIKGSKLIINQELKKEIEDLFGDKYVLKNISKEIYEIKWGKVEFLETNINNFVRLACESNWINHYFHTIDTFLYLERSSKRQEILKEIYKEIKNMGDKSKSFQECYIKNFLKLDLNEDSTLNNIQKTFLIFLRDNINV